MRDQLVERLTEDVRNNKEWLLDTVALSVGERLKPMQPLTHLSEEDLNVPRTPCGNSRATEIAPHVR